MQELLSFIDGRRFLQAPQTPICFHNGATKHPKHPSAAGKNDKKPQNFWDLKMKKSEDLNIRKFTDTKIYAMALAKNTKPI